MRPRLGPCLLLLLAALPARAEDRTAPGPELDRLKAHVATLASPEFAGRRGPGARKAEAYIIEHFRLLGLEPLFDGSFTQDIPGRNPGEVIGRNVGAMIPGADPALKSEWIILSAHFDHLGVRGGVLYPGADDNASGVAMLLEVARCLAESGSRPRRGIMLVAFDLEEDGLWGSRHFVARPPVPLDRIKLFITADLIAGSLGDICDRQVFVMGAENAPGLRPWIESAMPPSDWELTQVGSDLLLFDRSDYGPFRARKIPYLFFSTGENPRYHTPEDTPESLNYPKLQAASRSIARVVEQAADAPTVPAWQDQPDHTLSEVVAVCDVFKALLAHREALKLRGAQLSLVQSTIEKLEAIIQRGTVTPEERRGMVRAAQIVLFTVL